MITECVSIQHELCHAFSDTLGLISLWGYCETLGVLCFVRIVIIQEKCIYCLILKVYFSHLYLVLVAFLKFQIQNLLQDELL